MSGGDARFIVRHGVTPRSSGGCPSRLGVLYYTVRRPNRVPPAQRALSFTGLAAPLATLVNAAAAPSSRRLARCTHALVLGSAVLIGPRLAVAQRGDDGPPRLGLGASSAFGLYGGAGTFRHASLGPQIGGTLDLGWVGSRRVRLTVGIDYLATRIDRVDTLGVRQRGRGYVFSALSDVNVVGTMNRRVTPYAGAGVGVDAVGTTIQSPQIGTLYNTNVFDLHAQVGAYLRVAPRGRVTIEARGTAARVVQRVALRVGYTWLYNELAR